MKQKCSMNVIKCLMECTDLESLLLQSQNKVLLLNFHLIGQHCSMLVYILSLAINVLSMMLSMMVVL